MHAIAIATKRAHLRTTHHLKQYARAYGLTPARYDMLIAISRSPICFQTSLSRWFHVSRATVSRMLGALERLGLITRDKNRGRGSRAVQLTDEGSRVIGDAKRGCWRSICRIYQSMFGPRRPLGYYAVEVEELEQTILGVASFFGNTAWFNYRYGHPDD